MDVAKPQLAHFGGKSVLIVERFDRRWTADGRLLRLPQEDFCQALSIAPTRKYQEDGGPGLVQILELLRGSDDPLVDQRAFLKANILFLLMGATDGHAKNFSLFLRPGGRFQLAPLYDVISAQPSFDSKQMFWKQYRLAMSFGAKPHYAFRQISPRHFLETAERAGLGKDVVRSLLEELVAALPPAFERIVADLPENFPQDVVNSILDGIKRRMSTLKSSDQSLLI
jgi:serine/threonine-protein kinase HipA